MEQRPQPQKKKLKILLLSLLLAGVLCASIPLLINWHIISYAEPYFISPEDAAAAQPDCILVLGAGVWGDGRPSRILMDRLDTGIDLYRSGVSGRLLMSGDHGRVEYDEVNTMKGYAVEAGAPASHVFMDHAGFSTYESMVRAQEVFAVQSAVIVTQEYHLYRAVYIARRLGIDAHGVVAGDESYPGLPYYKRREFLARVKDYFYVLLRPAPTYLGEVIPVSGDGNLTNDK